MSTISTLVATASRLLLQGVQARYVTMATGATTNHDASSTGARETVVSTGRPTKDCADVLWP